VVATGFALDKFDRSVFFFGGKCKDRIPFSLFFRTTSDHIVSFNLFDGPEASAAVSLPFVLSPVPVLTISFPSNLDWESITKDSPLSVSFCVSDSKQWNVSIEAAIDNALD
jgi:hypothetical protein